MEKIVGPQHRSAMFKIKTEPQEALLGGRFGLFHGFKTRFYF